MEFLDRVCSGEVWGLRSFLAWWRCRRGYVSFMPLEGQPSKASSTQDHTIIVAVGEGKYEALTGGLKRTICPSAPSDESGIETVTRL